MLLILLVDIHCVAFPLFILRVKEVSAQLTESLSFNGSLKSSRGDYMQFKCLLSSFFCFAFIYIYII